MEIFIVTYCRNDVKIVLGAFSSNAKAIEYILQLVSGHRYEIISTDIVIDFSRDVSYDVVHCNLDFLAN